MPYACSRSAPLTNIKRGKKIFNVEMRWPRPIGASALVIYIEFLGKWESRTQGNIRGLIYMKNLLPIKFNKQSEPMYCYISCIKMIVDYAIDELNVSQHRLSIHKIANSTRTHRHGGTAWGDLERINDLLKDSSPQISFEHQVGGSLEDIITEYQNSMPLIAWILGVIDVGDELLHSVVINGVSEDRTKIFYIDPARIIDDYQLDVEIGDFLDNKLGVDGRLVKLKIEKIGQKDLLGKMGPIIRRRN